MENNLPENNLLDYMDQTFFLDFVSQKHGPPLIQFIWIYEHEVDLAALRRFHANLGQGLLGRCVERSPLPFGRHRWVRWTPPADFDIAAHPRHRGEVTDWADDQAAAPIDFEFGPPWRLSVLPLADGGAAVSLVVAHGVADGMLMSMSVADAVNGITSDPGYPPPRSRTRGRALREDLRETLRDLPDVAKALVKAPLAARAVPDQVRIRAGRERGVTRRKGLARRDGGGSPAVRGTNTDLVRTADLGRVVRLRSVTGFVDIAHWDERAKALGGASNPLLLGIAARLCRTLGWVDTEGLACFTIPVSERTPGDTRGNALTGVSLNVDPATATDLQGIRAGVKTALSTLTEARNQLLAPLPLTPFVPKFVARQLQDVLLKIATLTVSHFGDLDPAVNRPDGTDAEWFYVRHGRWAEGVTVDYLQRAGGLFLPLPSGRIGGRFHLTVSYANSDGSLTTEGLKAALQSAFDDFGVSGVIV